MLAQGHGYGLNIYNAPYKRGAAYELAKKMEVAATIQACQAGNTYEHTNITFVSCACKVSRNFVRKIVKELDLTKRKQEGTASLDQVQGS